jgi:hypothetical protein
VTRLPIWVGSCWHFENVLLCHSTGTLIPSWAVKVLILAAACWVVFTSAIYFPSGLGFVRHEHRGSREAPGMREQIE